MRVRRSTQPRPPTFYRTEAWIRLRRHVKQRDGYTCQACHRVKGPRARTLVVHHRCPRALFRGAGLALHPQADHPRNLVTLCQACHRKAHRGLLPHFLTLRVPPRDRHGRRPLH